MDNRNTPGEPSPEAHDPDAIWNAAVGPGFAEKVREHGTPWRIREKLRAQERQREIAGRPKAQTQEDLIASFNPQQRAAYEQLAADRAKEKAETSTAWDAGDAEEETPGSVFDYMTAQTEDEEPAEEGPEYQYQEGGGYPCETICLMSLGNDRAPCHLLQSDAVVAPRGRACGTHTVFDFGKFSMRIPCFAALLARERLER